MGIVWQWEIICLSAAIKWHELNVTMLSVLGSYVLWAMVCWVACCHTRSTMEHYWKYFQLLYAGCNEADLIDQDETLNTASCADRGVVNSSSISGGVVCYNGAIAGSRADYICNDGFVLVGTKATRVCQSDGNWNGSIPQCSPEEPGMYVCSPLSICTKIYTCWLVQI